MCTPGSVFLHFTLLLADLISPCPYIKEGVIHLCLQPLHHIRSMARSSLPLSPVLILFIVLVLNASILLSAKARDSSDLDALLKIKKQLGNPPDLSKWLLNTDCCTWLQGLQCSETDGRVNLVSLFDMNVTAPVPSALGDLPMLETIQLRRIPGLYGSIPSTLAKLSRLVLLEISDSSVSGPIPELLLKMNLSALAITNSKLTGTIPQFLSRLPNLRYINLSGNKLNGSIPPGLLHASFRVLILSNNHLTGGIPEDYGNGDIDTIDLSHNQLTGDPSFLFSTTKPTSKIDLSWNMLEFCKRSLN